MTKNFKELQNAMNDERQKRNAHMAIDNQTIIMVVGHDMSGKTNIVKELSACTGIPSFKASSEHRNFLSDQSHFLNELRYSDLRVADLLKQLGFSAIFDRGYPCERVYSAHFNRQTDISVLNQLDELHASLGTKIVVCERNDLSGVCDDLDPGLDETALTKIRDGYRAFLKCTKCQTMVLNVDDQDINREVSEILNFIER